MTQRELIGTAALLRDVTTRWQQEKALKERVAGLEAEVKVWLTGHQITLTQRIMPCLRNPEHAITPQAAYMLALSPSLRLADVWVFLSFLSRRGWPGACPL